MVGARRSYRLHYEKGWNVTIRKATSDDAEELLRLVEALAEYERLPPPDHAAKRRLVADMTLEHPRFEAYLAIMNGRSVGYAIVLETYSSFLALPTLYLEDIFVLPEFRGIGAGFALFQTIVGEAQRRGCGRMEWAVLEWNKPAINFYERLSAVRLHDWQHYRLTASDFERILSR